MSGTSMIGKMETDSTGGLITVVETTSGAVMVPSPRITYGGQHIIWGGTSTRIS